MIDTLTFKNGVTKASYDADSRFTRSPRPVDLAVSGERYGREFGGNMHKGWSPEELDMMTLNWMAEDKQKMLIRFGSHESEMTAGYIYELFTQQRDGLTYLCGLCEWNMDAQNAIDRGQLVGISVEAIKDYQSRRNGVMLKGWSIQAAALVSDPYYDLNDMRPVALSAGQSSGILLLSNRLKPKETKQMNELLKRLGLAENATEADALKALDALKAKTKEADAQAVELSTHKTKSAGEIEALTVKLSTAQAEMVKLQAERDALKAEADKLKAETEAVALSAFIDAGQRDGKIATTDADKALWTDLWKKDSGLATRMLSATSKKSPVGEAPTGLSVHDAELSADVKLQTRAYAIAAEKKISLSAAMSIAATEAQQNKK